MGSVKSLKRLEVISRQYEDCSFHSKLANKMVGIKNRDIATVKQLNSLDEVEGMILHVIRLGMAGNKHYKEIYADCKRRLEFWQDCTFRLTA